MSVDFFERNIFIYLFDDTSPTKAQVARRLIDKALELDNGCISFQVVQETLRVITGKLPKPANLDLAQEFLRDTLVPMWRVTPRHAP
jgi:predicted nucleic acid-binding protein